MAQSVAKGRVRGCGKCATHSNLEDPDEVIWVIVGDLKKVEAGIRELNLGAVEKLDSDKL